MYVPPFDMMSSAGYPSPVRPVFGGIDPEGKGPQQGLKIPEDNSQRHPSKEENIPALQHERNNKNVTKSADRQYGYKDLPWSVTRYFPHANPLF